MTSATKPFWQSKTVWIQALAVAGMFIPAVAAWVKTNPVEFVAALAALNTLVRFATHGSLAIFTDDDDSSGSSSPTDAGPSGGKKVGAPGGDADYRQVLQRTWLFPWLVVAACAVAILLPACTVGVDAEGGWSVRPDPRTVDAGLRYLIRHEEDEAKGGLTQWKYYDPATGEEIAEEDYAAWGIKP